MKTCTECRRTLPREEFWPRLKGRPELRAACKRCTASRRARDFRRRYRESPEFRARMMEHQRTWRASHPERAKQIARQAYARRSPEQERRYRAAARVAEHMVAHASAAYRVALAGYCSFCGETRKTVRHHCDYSQPLVVLEMCHGCHKRWHADEREWRRKPRRAA